MFQQYLVSVWVKGHNNESGQLTDAKMLRKGVIKRKKILIGAAFQIINQWINNNIKISQYKNTLVASLRHDMYRDILKKYTKRERRLGKSAGQRLLYDWTLNVIKLHIVSCPSVFFISWQGENQNASAHIRFKTNWSIRNKLRRLQHPPLLLYH